MTGTDTETGTWTVMDRDRDMHTDTDIFEGKIWILDIGNAPIFCSSDVEINLNIRFMSGPILEWRLLVLQKFSPILD
jgi:hypothetical protein